METVAVSLIISAYKTARCTGRTVEPILAQTFDRIGLITIGDGSTDDTLRVASSGLRRQRQPIKHLSS